MGGPVIPYQGGDSNERLCLNKAKTHADPVTCGALVCSEFVYFEVEDKNTFSSVSIGMCKVALRDIPATNVESTFNVSQEPT
jgi:hypothetical protein